MPTFVYTPSSPDQPEKLGLWLPPEDAEVIPEDYAQLTLGWIGKNAIKQAEGGDPLPLDLLLEIHEEVQAETWRPLQAAEIDDLPMEVVLPVLQLVDSADFDVIHYKTSVAMEVNNDPRRGDMFKVNGFPLETAADARITTTQTSILDLIKDGTINYRAAHIEPNLNTGHGFRSISLGFMYDDGTFLPILEPYSRLDPSEVAVAAQARHFSAFDALLGSS